MSAERANYLITKYLYVNAQVLERYEQIKRVYFEEDMPTIGVFYQQPINDTIQKDWDPSSLCNRVQQVCNGLSNYRIFLFTSLEGYAEVFREYFGSAFYCIPNVISDDDTTPLRRGENELLTLLLLSNCSIVIAPGSYQATGAHFLNVELKLIELDTIPYDCL